MIAAWASRFLKIALLPLLALTAAQACGPDFFPDTFVRQGRPDLPEQFVRGRLGILQPGFPRADLLVAYRYLTGGTLNAAEQKAWSPTYSLAESYYGQQPPDQMAATSDSSSAFTPVSLWATARRAFRDAPSGPPGQEAAIKVRLPGGYEYNQNFSNCGDDAFRVAADTLEARAKTWGKDSLYLMDWLRGQDVVFRNCSGGAETPVAAAEGSPAVRKRRWRLRRAARRC